MEGSKIKEAKFSVLDGIIVKRGKAKDKKGSPTSVICYVFVLFCYPYYLNS